MWKAVYLEIADPDSFIAELKVRGLTETRQTELVKTYNVFQKIKRRFTALDRNANVIVRFDLPFYHDFTVKDDYGKEKYSEGLKTHVEPFLRRLEESGFKVLNGEYHNGKTEW